VIQAARGMAEVDAKTSLGAEGVYPERVSSALVTLSGRLADRPVKGDENDG
jgi:hypothetical protein